MSFNEDEDTGKDIKDEFDKRENSDNLTDSTESTEKEDTLEFKAEEPQDVKTDDIQDSKEEYERYKQYSEYSKRMNAKRPVDAQFQPRQYQTYYNQDSKYQYANQPPKKKHIGLIIVASIVGVLFTFSLGVLSLFVIANSQLGALIGFGITNAFTQNVNEDIMPGESISGDVTKNDDPKPSGIENPPSLNIVSVAPKEIEKIYDTSGREVLDASQIYERVSPCVVSIRTKVAAEGGLGYSNVSGSGIIFSQDGYIITNAHVISGATVVNVLLASDSEMHPAKVIGYDEKADIAVIKIEAEGLPVAEFGDSDLLKIGDNAVAIGNPTSLDLRGATTQGIISGLNREIVVDDNGRVLTLIQTDAAINPGNSGGPLINKYGQVIGINTIGLKSVTYEGLNFAIPSNTAKPIIEELLQYGFVKGYPTIGITGQPVTPYQSQMYNVPLGIIIESVNPNSDAAKKGIAVYDIITHINKVGVTNVGALNTEKNKHNVGDAIRLTIFRDGKTFDANILLMDENDLK